MELNKTKLIAIAAVALVFIGVLLFKGSVNVTIKEDVVNVRSSSTSLDIPYTDILSIKLVKDIDTGERLFGSSAISTVTGRFANEEYGEYLLLAYKRNRVYVEIKTAEDTILFNARSKKQTEYYVQAITTMIDVKQGQ